MAQQDSLLYSDTTVATEKDSIVYPILRTNPMFGPEGYIGCTIPLLKNYFKPFIYHSGYDFESPYTAKGAKQDLRNGKPLILFPGGIVGRDFSSKADQEFQSRYQVQFVSQGCIRFPGEDLAAYNEVIFQYLDKKYGIGWRNELGSDPIGFEKPISSQCKSTDYLTSPLAMQLANPEDFNSKSINPDTGTSVWWYILPTSSFALLLSLYFFKRRKD